MPRPIRAAIFDLDGTLVDSLSHIGNACNHVLTTLKHPILPISEYAALAGVGNRLLIERTLLRSTGVQPKHPQISHAVSLKRRYDDQVGATHLSPFDDAAKALNELKKAGVQIAVLSNKAEHLVRESVKICLPDIEFVVVHGARDEVPLKPSAVPALEIMNAFKDQVTAEECAFIGDTTVDIQTAVAAGMVPIGVSWGFRSKDELISAGAKVVLDKPMDIVDIINRCN